MAKRSASKKASPRKGRGGRPAAVYTLWAAMLTSELINEYRVRPEKCAVNAATESVRALFKARTITEVAVGRAYRKLKKGGGTMITNRSHDKYQLAYIDDGVIDDALMRLPASAKGKRTGRAPHPPFNIVLARMYDWLGD